jgi:protein-S-isoprenylcysteine O-methyltransferase Ste14
MQIGVFTLMLGASLFIPSGRLGWGMAWAYIGLFAAGQIITALVLIPSNPELIAERSQLGQGKGDLDRVLAGFVVLYGPLSMCVVAGLDERFGWSGQMGLALQVAALAVTAMETLLGAWAMASNKFFYGTLRIARERGHTVATGGPYRYVRHPSYVGGILFALATPPALGSLWAFIPAVLTVGVFFVRTALEDRALQEKLLGYAEYAQQTRYRLLPGVW